MKKSIVAVSLLIFFGISFANEYSQQESLEINIGNANNKVYYEDTNDRIKANNSIPLSEKYMEIQDYLSKALPAIPFSNSLYTEDCVIYETISNNVVNSISLILQNLGYEVAVIQDKFQPNELSHIFYSEYKENLQNALSSFDGKMIEDKKM
ncbi:hypothetical protein [Helicobacter labetoulli]|uniref:hypothetical protein n=1 Tax=Helicobacter labetoulli TaxID=2315333 RepID=UPI000EF67B4D|nr:hypothetical protein [Helicobacter labetoulli]